MKNKKNNLPQKRSFFFYLKWACGLVLLIILLLLLISWLIFSSQRRRWTESQPAQIELAEDTAGRAVDGARLYRDTRRALESNSAQRLQFNQREFSALMRNAPELQSLQEKMALQLQEDSLRAIMSVPLDAIPGFSGRYLNGDFIFDLSIEQGVPELILRSGEVRGKAVPRHFLEQIGKYAQREASRQLQTHADLKRIESLRLENGKMILQTSGK